MIIKLDDIVRYDGRTLPMGRSRTTLVTVMAIENGKYMIVDGHLRVLAARGAGIESIECEVLH